MSPQPRAGRRDLARLQQTLSERDRAVLQMVANHRFLTTRHLEGFCFADHATPLAGARACRRVLARLYRDRLLTRLARRVGGVRAGSASFVWALGPVGDRIVRDGDDRRPRRRWQEPSTTFLAHTLAVADTHLALRRAATAGHLTLVAVETEPRCWRSYLGHAGERISLRPDLYLVTAAGEWEDCWFIEVDRGTESLPRLLDKCAQYQAYRKTGVEQAARGVFPLVVWVMPTPIRAEQLASVLRVAERHTGGAPLFRITTATGLVALMARGGTA